MKITAEMVRGHGPCERYVDEGVDDYIDLDKVCPVDVSDLADFRKLRQVPAGDRVWIICHLMSDKQRRRFARWCALRVIHLWDAKVLVREYLETGDESLRAAAAAYDAYAAAAAYAADAAYDASAAAAAYAADAAAFAAAAYAAASAAAAYAADAAAYDAYAAYAADAAYDAFADAAAYDARADKLREFTKKAVEILAAGEST